MDIYQKFCMVVKQFDSREALLYRKDNGKYDKYTFGEVQKKSDIYYESLIRYHFEKGDRIILVGESSPKWFFSLFAITRLGGVPVLMDATLPADEMKRLFDMAHVKGCVASKKVVSKISTYKEPISFPVLMMGEEGLQPSEIDAKQADIPNAIPSDISDSMEGIAAMFFSSGTTTTAKCVMVKYSSIEYKVMQCPIRVNENDRYLMILPLYHIYGFVISFWGLFHGSSVCILENINQINDTMQEYKPTVLFAVPKLYEIMYKKIMSELSKKSLLVRGVFKTMIWFNTAMIHLLGVNLGKHLFKSIHQKFGGALRVTGSGGAKLEQGVATILNKMDILNYVGYGLTEACVPATISYPKDIIKGTLGQPFPGAQVKLLEPDTNQVGEIVIQSPGLMAGYFNDLQATQSAFTKDGWLKTGDLGRYNKNGSISIIGRVKESIIFSNGKKASPMDLEKIYSGIDNIIEFAICGITRKDKGYDEVHAFFVLEIDTQEMREKIKSEISKIAAKMPVHLKIKNLHFIQDIPKTALGKPKRYLLKDFMA